jgi:hypothetical protein
VECLVELVRKRHQFLWQKYASFLDLFRPEPLDDGLCKELSHGENDLFDVRLQAKGPVSKNWAVAFGLSRLIPAGLFETSLTSSSRIRLIDLKPLELVSGGSEAKSKMGRNIETIPRGEQNALCRCSLAEGSGVLSAHQPGKRRHSALWANPT